MLLTIATTFTPATELSYLLHKHPDRFQRFELGFGAACVFYPEFTEERAEIALWLEIDSVGILRGQSIDKNFHLGQYVNDRPFVASSFLSTAISQVFGSALNGRSKERPELVKQPIPLVAKLDVIPCQGGESFLRRVFEPLGYDVVVEGYPLDAANPTWGMSRYFSVSLSATKTVADLLNHLYVLIPAFDGAKHYFVGDAEVEKLLEKGKEWIASHPEREEIAKRYLCRRWSLYREAMARLTSDANMEAESETVEVADAADDGSDDSESIPLNEQRMAAVASAIQASGARTVIDLGCGEGKLLKRLSQEKQFDRLAGVDVHVASIEFASRRLRKALRNEAKRERVQLFQGSLTYRDARFAGFDTAALVEVIEHLDPPRLKALERVVFEFAAPGTIVVTTPNAEYNVKWPSLPQERFRHEDHRFEWTRAEFQNWANRVAHSNGYNVRFEPIGLVDEQVGSPTQMAIFTRSS